MSRRLVSGEFETRNFSFKKMKLSKKKRAKVSQTNLVKLRARACFLRDNGRCIKCGGRRALAPSHIYPKGRYPRMAWVHDNVKTLCNPCHIFWWHKHPIEAAEWIKTAIAPDRYQRLKEMAKPNGMPPVNLEAVKEELEALIEKYLSEGRDDFLAYEAWEPDEEVYVTTQANPPAIVKFLRMVLLKIFT